jgi:type I restriction enzyme, S subunit
MTAWPLVPFGELLTKSEEWVKLDPFGTYKQVTVKLWGHGVIERNTVQGHEIGSDTRLVVRTDQFLISRIDARNGACGVVPTTLDGAVVSNDFPTFTVNRNRLEPQFLNWYTKTSRFVEDCKAASEGTTNRVRLKEDRFLVMATPLPPIEQQRRLVGQLSTLSDRHSAVLRLRQESEAQLQAVCRSMLFSEINSEATRMSDLVSLRQGRHQGRASEFLFVRRGLLFRKGRIQRTDEERNGVRLWPPNADSGG